MLNEAELTRIQVELRTERVPSISPGPVPLPESVNVSFSDFQFLGKPSANAVETTPADEWIVGSTMKARVSHGQFPPGGTFASSQRVRWPYASNNCNLREDLAQDTPIPEEWRSSLDSFAKVDGTVFPEPPMEEGIAHFCSERS